MLVLNLNVQPCTTMCKHGVAGQKTNVRPRLSTLYPLVTTGVGFFRRKGELGALHDVSRTF